MRGGRHLTEAAAAVEFVPARLTDQLGFDALFPNWSALLEVDLGCGDGSFLAALAAQHPERNFLGIEQMLGRVRSSCRRIARSDLTNARIIRAEIATGVRDLLPAQSVDVFHLMFPDPWPKRRHHRRRVFTRELVEWLHAALRPSGLLHLVTDQADYFRHMIETLGVAALFVEADSAAFAALPRSTFEARFVDAGEAIYRLVLRKISG